MNIFPFSHSPHANSMRLRRASRASWRLLFYGLFAVLCQLSLILLHTIFHAEHVSGALLALRFAPMLEHSLMSLTILAVGVYLIERTILEANK